MCIKRKKKHVASDSLKRVQVNDETSGTTHSFGENTQTTNVKGSKSVPTDHEKLKKNPSSVKQMSMQGTVVPVYLVASSSERSTPKKKGKVYHSPVVHPPAETKGVNFNSTDGSSDGDKEKQASPVTGGSGPVPHVSPIVPVGFGKSKRAKTETTDRENEGTEEGLPTKTDDVMPKVEKPVPPKGLGKPNSPRRTGGNLQIMSKEKPKLNSVKKKKPVFKHFESIGTLDESKDFKTSEALAVDRTQQDSPNNASSKLKHKRKYAAQQAPSTILASMTKDRSTVHRDSKKKNNGRSVDIRKTNTTLLVTDHLQRKTSANNDNVEELSRVPVVRMMTMKAEKFPIKDDNHMDTLDGMTSNFSSSIKPSEAEMPDATATTQPTAEVKSTPPLQTPGKKNKTLELEKTQQSFAKLKTIG